MKNGGLCIRREVNAMQKHIAVWIICLGMAFGFPNRSRAFEYNVWKSGMEMEAALKLAEINDIPITWLEFDKPLERGRHHFRKELVKRAKKSRNLCYKQNLSGAVAVITLHFTPMSKQLSYVAVYWMDAGPAQQKEAILDLSHKYGEPSKYSPQKDILPGQSGLRPENAISETRFFVPDQQNIIAVQNIKTRYRQQDQNRM
jgi:hypothetical protein